MTTLISQSTPISKKDRICMASEWIANGDFSMDYFTFTERKAIVLAKRNGWKIRKGEKYFKAFVKCCGDAGNFVAIPAMHAICLKYGIYEDEC